MGVELNLGPHRMAPCFLRKFLKGSATTSESKASQVLGRWTGLIRNCNASFGPKRQSIHFVRIRHCRTSGSFRQVPEGKWASPSKDFSQTGLHPNYGAGSKWCLSVHKVEEYTFYESGWDLRAKETQFPIPTHPWSFLGDPGPANAPHHTQSIVWWCSCEGKTEP